MNAADIIKVLNQKVTEYGGSSKIWFVLQTQINRSEVCKAYTICTHKVWCVGEYKFIAYESSYTDRVINDREKQFLIEEANRKLLGDTIEFIKSQKFKDIIDGRADSYKQIPDSSNIGTS